jgi:MFS family permease
MASVPAQTESPAEQRVTPLSRNRNFTMLWIGELFSELGGEIAFISFPLLVLFTSKSPVETGLILSVTAVARMAATLPAGLAADRSNRRRLMLLCQLARVVAMGSLAIALYLGTFSFAHMLVVAAVEGFFSSAFEPVEHAALAQLVHPTQLSQALARNAARPYAATLIGPAFAGVLFAVLRTLPFAVATGLLVISLGCLSTLRIPSATPPPPDAEHQLLRQAGEGLRWVLGNRLIRTTLLWLAFSQLVFSALIVVILAASGEGNLPAGQIGLMMTCVGAGGLLGAACAGRLHAALPPAVIVLGFSWIAPVLALVMTLVPVGLPIGVVLAGLAFFVPVVMTTVMTHQLEATPDQLRGRLSGAVGLCTGGAGALGPVVAGFAMGGGARTSLLVCAGVLAVVAVGTTLSPTLRRFSRSNT